MLNLKTKKFKVLNKYKKKEICFNKLVTTEKHLWCKTDIYSYIGIIFDSYSPTFSTLTNVQGNV